MKLKLVEKEKIMPTSLALELGSKCCSCNLGETRRYDGLLTVHSKSFESSC